MLKKATNTFKKIHWGIKLSTLGLAFTFTAFSPGDEHFFEITKNLDIFTNLYRELNIYYVDDTDPGKLMKTGIDAMLESLDPYTNYYPESDIEDYRFMTTGQYGGIGAMIRRKDEFVVISEPYENFPAHKAGLKAGDVILEVDGNSVKGKNSSELSDLLKGQPGTDVKVLIERPGTNDPFEVSLTREEIQVSSVPYYGMVNETTGYIVLTSFTDKAGREVKNALLELKKNKQLENVVLDLRNNPGGLLRESINIVNFFVKKGEEVVSTRSKIADWDKIYKALNAPVDKDIKVAVLINGNSASASEIVSGSLQDLDRGVVVGQKSFGKGLVQQTRPLAYNSKLKLTTAKYYTPSGRCIQAIDYSHRDDDGKVSKIPDSLITEYKTRNGRSVFDGEGITPDLEVEPIFLSNISVALMTQNHIFDFATQYCLNHDSIDNPASFKLNEDDWTSFKSFMSTLEFDFETKTEKDLAALIESLEKEGYKDDLAVDIDHIETKINESKKSDLDEYKEEIIDLIEREIVTRYFYQKGKIIHSLQNDPELDQAIEILSNSEKYNTILNPEQR